MHSRTAWIVYSSCGMLFFALVALNLQADARETDQRERTSSSIQSVSQSLPLGSTLERYNGPPVDPVDQATLSGSTLQPLNRIRLVSYTATLPDSDGNETSETQYWPTAESLIDQIKLLPNVPEVRGWSEHTITLLEALSKTEQNSNVFDGYLGQLERQLQAVPQIAASIKKRGGNSAEAVYAQCEVSRMAYRMQRRLAIWNTLRSDERASNSKVVGVFHSFGSDSNINSVSFTRINFEGLDPNWIEYLKLEELQAAFRTLNPNEAEQKKVARSVLARIYSPVLKREQAEYIQQLIDPLMIESLKKLATGPVEDTELLKRIENYETQSSSLTGFYLNDQYQNLLWSTDSADQAVASQIQTHYRNANLRLAVSERLLNRLIPDLPTTASPVSQNVKGARVSGQSQVSNQLHVGLLPHPNQIQLQLATTGNVQSDTIAKTKSFRIQNFGKAQFKVVQQVTISPTGIEASTSPHALSKAKQYVVGLESKMDDVPVVGWMARKLAAKKLREEGPDNDRIFKRTVESSAEAQMEQQVAEQLVNIRHLAYTKLFQPLFAMDLEPESLQMSTTDNHAVMRYRLAGRDQMAANTSRPRDDGNSLLSVQLHQSAINNAIARIGLNGNKFTIDELEKHLRDVVDAPPMESAAQESDKYAEIGFAYFDPFHIDFQNDRVNITLNLKSLKIGETGKTWKNVSLTASYRIAVDGMTINLLQDDDGTRIKGKYLRFGDRAAISTVMKVLFKQQYSMNSLPEKLYERVHGEFLEVSQLVVSDGWLAVSIDDQTLPTANHGQGDGQRTGAIRKLIQRR